MKRFLIPLTLLCFAAPVNATPQQDDFVSGAVVTTYAAGQMVGHIEAMCSAHYFAKFVGSSVLSKAFLNLLIVNWMNEPEHFQAKKIAVKHTLEQFRTHEHWQSDKRGKVGDICANALEKQTRGY